MEHLQKEDDSGSLDIDPSLLVLNVEPVSLIPLGCVCVGGWGCVGVGGGVGNAVSICCSWR